MRMQNTYGARPTQAGVNKIARSDMSRHIMYGQNMGSQYTQGGDFNDRSNLGCEDKGQQH